MRFFIAMMMGLFFTAVYANENIMPPLCKPIMVNKDVLTLSAKKPTLVLIYNHSSSELWLSHPVADASASAGWTSQLEAQKWSALALSDESFILNCIESKPGHEQEIPCQGLISVCKWPNVSMGSQEKATYWAGENMSFPALRTYLGDRGFKLPSK